MVHAVHRSIQVYQDFHRQTLSHLQKLEQNCYKLMPQFNLEQVLGMVERAHRMKAGARYLRLTGFEKLSFHVKGRYMALMGLSLTVERDLLKQLIQMKELFRLCLLSNVATWQADLGNVVAKLPQTFQLLDQSLNLHPQFSRDYPSQAELEADIQRLLVAIVLIPELARLDMMLKNTPASKLSDILTSQLPRLQTLAQQLQLQEIQRSMQISLLEIQARPSHAKAIGSQALLKWSDLAYQTLTSNTPKSIHAVEEQTAPKSFPDACVTHFESTLIECSVELIEGNEDCWAQSLQTHAHAICELADTFEITDLRTTTEAVLNAIEYHPDQSRLIGRLAIQDWLRHQLHGLLEIAHQNSEGIPTSDALLEMADKPLHWDDAPTAASQDSALMGFLSQVELPDGFREFTSEDTQTLAINSEDLAQLHARLQLCQQEIERLPAHATSLSQTFEALLNDYHQLVSISLSHVFSRFQPMVDALGLQSYKEVSLQTSSGQIAIDRYQGETLYEVLIPLISNAVIHGLEKADERQRLGKSRKGRLFISAYPQGNDVLIEIRDDGRGLNFEILREWVIQRNNLTLQEANFLTESELLDYVFKGSPDNPSKLGAQEDGGLSALQSTLDKLNGSIEVSTVTNQGTTFRLLLPGLIVPTPQLQQTETHTTVTRYASTSSSDYSLESLRHQGKFGPRLTLDTQGLFIWADALSVFLLECDRIEEYVMPHITEAHQSLTSLTWRDQVIPIFSLQDFIGKGQVEDNQPSEDVILVIKGEAQFLALRAPMDHLVGDKTLSINPLSQALAAPRYIYGTTELQNAPPRLVVDVAALIAQQPLQSLFPLSESATSNGADAKPEQPESASDLPQIMVVDDSRTAREIVSLTLRHGGYDVLQAKDGVDALEQLRSLHSTRSLVDLVISDVAMPRMNGLEFVRQCRQDHALQSLPIAMLSNCDSTTHSDLALREGANAYLTKPYQEDVFLAEIARLLEREPQAASNS